MRLDLKKVDADLKSTVNLPGSKSESNRLLILQALFPSFQIENLSNSEDTQVLKKALTSDENHIHIGHAGTAMRFLTAYFSIQNGRELLLTGSERMQNRPIGILVEALRDLGARIEYEKKQGFPPLKIKGSRLEKNQVEIQAGVSSQYISGLMLIAPVLPEGMAIFLKGKTTSFPYLKMTAHLLGRIGIPVEMTEEKIRVGGGKKITSETIQVESDWSAASYFFGCAALSKKAQLVLSGLRPKSVQGDAQIRAIFREFGVKSKFENGKLIVEKVEKTALPNFFEYDCSGIPDLAQTLAVTCLGLKIPCRLTGLHTLTIKETDRLQALKNELEKLGGQVKITDQSLSMEKIQTLVPDQNIQTYQDHRMAMAFAPLALKVTLSIENPEVVKKSFPGFWEELDKMVD